MNMILLLSLLMTNSWAQTKTTVELGASGSKAFLTWNFSDDKSSKQLIELNVGKIKITPDSDWLNADEALEVTPIDINFDKKNDFAITIRRGVSNRYVLYLLWDETKKEFISLGEMPELTRIDKTNCWSGFEKGNEENAINLKVENNKLVKCILKTR